ncbi:ABC transporter permease [Pseudonocardia pini]|uniref:ABC transporter permease n=1 Tax=Pseudonocardia pini TaxID=2758030 RepID=UPI0015F0E7A5|nr:ABC transporter permease [Pseudonocardia pini]
MRGLRLGLRRGWITWRAVNTTREGLANTVFWNLVPLVVLILLRNQQLEGFGVSATAALLPGIMAITVVFGVMGIAYYLANEREDGTLLRAKATPGGMQAYVIGLVVVAALDVAAGLLIVGVPGMFLLSGVPVGSAVLWLGLLGYLVLGLLACLSVGLLIGSVVKNPRTIGGVGFLATAALSALSGLFFPVQVLWGWVQVLVQLFPMYWLGLGLRSVFLPAEAAVLELGGSWRTVAGLLVLGGWAAVGLGLGPVLLRRMARRESGSRVEARREAALQRA